MVFGKVVFFLILCTFLVNGIARNRRNRLFSFNSLDGEVSVDLEFSIPFITIPVKKTMESFGGTGLGLTLPTINVNVAALALGGAVVLGTVVILPLIVKATSKNYLQKPYARILDNAQIGSSFVLDLANQLMMDSGGFQRCTLRVACWTGQQALEEDVRRIMDQVSSNRILTAFVNATALEEAVSAGRRGRDCSFYRPCPIRNEHIPYFLNNLKGFGKT